MVQDAGWNVSHFVHIPSRRKEGEAREERIISSVKKQHQVAAYTISIMFHWQAVCFVFNGLDLILQKTRQMAIERQLAVSARMVMFFTKFYSEGEVGNMEVAGWGSGQGRGIVLFFKSKEVWACLNNKIKLPVEKLKENTVKRMQLEPLLRYLEVKKRWVF